MFWFNMIKKYYSKGYYKDEDVKIFVEIKKISEEEYKEVTGIDYIQ